MSGFNATVFAYGATGTGKTFSIMGYNHDPAVESAHAISASEAGIFTGEVNVSPTSLHGIIPRFVADVFAHIEDADEDIEFTIKLSMLEIYMEKVRDLLNPENDNLKLRESPFGIFAENATQCYISSDEEVYQILSTGSRNRMVAATDMNEESSRSHCVLLVTVGQNNTQTGEKTGGKFTFVDLAGSEKIERSGVEGQSLKEAQHINKSLSALGNVIHALSSGAGHVPYRDSKLTRLLSDSIGGNSKTALLVTCSPSPLDSEETLSTLRFGRRAKTVKNKPIVNKERTLEEYRALLVEATRYARTGINKHVSFSFLESHHNMCFVTLFFCSHHLKYLAMFPLL